MADVLVHRLRSFVLDIRLYFRLSRMAGREVW